MKWKGLIQESAPLYSRNSSVMLFDSPDMIAAAMTLWGYAFDMEAKSGNPCRPVFLEEVIVEEEEEEDDGDGS